MVGCGDVFSQLIACDVLDQGQAFEAAGLLLMALLEVIRQLHLWTHGRAQWADAVSLQVKDLFVSLHAVVQIRL